MSSSMGSTSAFDPVERVALGRTRALVTRLSVGTVPLSGLFERVDDDDARAIVAAAWDAGVRAFDVAPLYGYGFAERIVGEVLRERPRSEWTLSTKVGRIIAADGPPAREDTSITYEGHPRFPETGGLRIWFDFTYDGVMRSIEASRERLGMERLDVLHIHDPEAFMDEAVDGAYRALDELRAAGIVAAVGVGANLWQTHLTLARRADFDCFLLAGRYTLLDQSALAELLPECERRGISIIAAGVYNSGILSHPDPGSIGQVSRHAADMATWKDNVTFDYAPAEAPIIERAARIKAVCDRHGVPLKAAALQFPLHHPAVACVLVGPRSPEHAVTNAEMLRVRIPNALWGDLKAEGLLADEAPTP